MTTDYKAVMTELATELASAMPTRIITRSYQDFAAYTPFQLKAGVVTLMANGIAGYPYEHRPADLGRQRLMILVQGVLPDKCTGEDIDDAEFEAIHELESLAEAEFDRPDLLAALQIKSITQSGQMERPYWWVMSQWEIFAEDE